jgi:SOS-response transcriptional repressor LexA
MLPCVASGDVIITTSSGQVAMGDVVVMALPDYGLVVKRVRQVTEHWLELASDNRETFSSCCGSRQAKVYLVGTVVFRVDLKRLLRRVKGSWSATWRLFK